MAVFMTSIHTEPGVFTLINSFEVERENQSAVIELLIDITERFTRYRPGFLSATVHSGVDGEHVANYVQWQSSADFEATFDTPEMQQHMRELGTLVKALRPLIYQIAYTRSAGDA